MHVHFSEILENNWFAPFQTMKTNLYKVFHKIILLFFCFGYIANAQPTEPCGGPTQPPCDPKDLPIDANITLLVIAAILFGIYTIYKYKLNQKRPA